MSLSDVLVHVNVLLLEMEHYHLMRKHRGAGGEQRVAAVLSAVVPHGPGPLPALLPEFDGHRALCSAAFLEHGAFSRDSNSMLALLLSVYCNAESEESALRVVGRWVQSLTGRCDIRTDSRLALLAARTPQTWAPGAGVDARALLSPAARAALVLPVLLAVNRLPLGVARSVLAHLRARPWLMLAARVAAPAAEPAPPAPPRRGKPKALVQPRWRP